jgi:hypothetical protein
MNIALTRTDTEEEVWDALQAIEDLKAPGPDGVPSIFYKKFWQLLGDKGGSSCCAEWWPFSREL